MAASNLKRRAKGAKVVLRGKNARPNRLIILDGNKPGILLEEVPKAVKGDLPVSDHGVQDGDLLLILPLKEVNKGLKGVVDRGLLFKAVKEVEQDWQADLWLLFVEGWVSCDAGQRVAERGAFLLFEAQDLGAEGKG